jgi:zinc transport system ATP-binding protein
MTGIGEDSLLEIQRLAIRRHHEAIVDDASMRVGRGTLHVIVGPNGAGKSTLIGAVLGLIPFDGQIVLNWKHMGTVGYVPQTFQVDPTLPVTVEDFLALTRQRRPVCLGLSAESRRTVARLLGRVGLSGLEQRPLAVLSGGELRRVLLAHALEPEPELLILDEPTSGLDETAARWLEETLTTIKRGGRTTVLMVSHDLDQVRRLADRVTVLDRRIVAEGPVADVLGGTTIRDLIPAGSTRWRRA